MTDETEEKAGTAVPQAAKKTERPKKVKKGKRRKQRVSATKGPAAEPKPAKGKPGRSRPFPAESLEKAVEVAFALRDKNGGNSWATEEVANALKLSRGGVAFFYVAGASRDYGLTTGSRDTDTIALTDLGKSLCYPAGAEETAKARLTAFQNVDSFAKVLAHYGGNRLPELEYVKNTLKRVFGIDEEYHEDFVKIFKANCVFVGLKDGQMLSAQGSPLADRRSEDATRREDATDTITVAEPKDNGTGLCFVIMPFVEKSDARPKNFFNEVLKRLVIPACVDVGFRVVTADRRGSDVIHSTIVNSLLDADLVVADLTDHNPNVLFELGMRMHEDKPVALIQAEGTARIFDVDNILRVYSYNPNLWTSTLETDKPALAEHVKAAWDNRGSAETYMKLLRKKKERHET